MEALRRYFLKPQYLGEDEKQVRAVC